MKYVDEFRDRHLVEKVARQIREEAASDRVYTIMEVCGTHTMNIFRFGLRDLLPANICLISGPGCPVCVTPNTFLDKALAIAAMKDVIVATFGDMFRVPGSYSSLEREKARGCAIRTVYSSIDALELARKNPSKEIVFLGVGFETTIPTIASSILIARKENIGNYSVLCGHKTMPKALEALVRDSRIQIDAFLLPGHVSAIIGTAPYAFLSRRYARRCVVAGFEPLDIMQAILMLIRQSSARVEIQYTRIVTPRGNILARRSITRVFEQCDSVWRGMGKIKKSGLAIRKEYADLDADARFRPKTKPSTEEKLCLCGDVLKGIRTPPECVLFAKRCNPEHPVGACMVSSEGTCAAYYRYGRQ